MSKLDKKYQKEFYEIISREIPKIETSSSKSTVVFRFLKFDIYANLSEEFISSRKFIELHLVSAKYSSRDYFSITNDSFSFWILFKIERKLNKYYKREMKEKKVTVVQKDNEAAFIRTVFNK